MSLSHIANPAHETIRGMRFFMVDGVDFVSVLVTYEALEEIEATPSTKGANFDRFEKHRKKFEQIAIKKFDRGQVEITGVVIVHAGDRA